MSKHLTPFQVCERLIGPAPMLGPICGLGEKAAYNWPHPSNFRDAGDIPSARLMRALLDHAEAQGIPLTARHLIRGAAASEIDALLADRQAPREAAE